MNTGSQSPRVGVNDQQIHNAVFLRVMGQLIGGRMLVWSAGGRFYGEKSRDGRLKMVGTSGDGEVYSY